MGRMSETTTTVVQNSNGQYWLCVPKAIGDANELAGKKISWKQGSASNKLELVIQSD